MTVNEEAQRDELLALTSIYDTLTTSFATEDLCCERAIVNPSGTLSVHIDIPTSIEVFTKTDSSQRSVNGQNVDHLPPIMLDFKFPPDYPQKSPPDYTLSCLWLDKPRLSRLCCEMDKLWINNYGSEIMFIWAEFLKTDALKLLGIESNITVNDNSIIDTFDGTDIDTRVSTTLPTGRMLFDALMEFNQDRGEEMFKTKMFDCNVCFSERSGSNCIEFWPCKHVYCRECMKGYFEVQISEGNLKSLKCPEDKCESDALPLQVQSLVSPESFARWEKFLLNLTLSSLKDIKICPRKHCQYPVTMEEQQGHCPSCDFVFCGICSYSWHGVEPCKLLAKETKDMIEHYKEADIKEKRELEIQYGKRQLTNLLNEELSLGFIEEISKTCPNCQANIEKIGGCNKMTCNKCKCSFCWLCNQRLNRHEPYLHYRMQYSPCYNKLFEGILLEDEEGLLDVGEED